MILLPRHSWKIKNSGKMGRGVFATREIAAETIIGDYIGKIVRSRDEYKYNKFGHIYLMYYHNLAYIYPLIKDNGIHVLNHSCTPNVWMYTYKGHALYFAIRKIFPGEELTVSYQLSPEDKDCSPCTHQCHCESVNCTGTMHLSKDKYEKWVAFDNKIDKKTKRKRIRFNKTLSLLDKYPKTIPDASFYTLFGNVRKNPKKIAVTKLPGLSEIRNLIRESGQTIIFPKLNLHVLGVSNGHITSKPIK